MVVVVLDEMDNRVTKGQEVLYNLFQLATYQHSTVLMIGVANSIDLVHRLLPRLHAMDCQPETLHFKAYDHTSLKELLAERLGSLPGPVFEPPTLELCGRKVAAAAGDMRRALGASKKALELMLEDHGAQAEAAALPRPPRVTLRHMAAALALVFKSPVVDAIRTLPQHQQLVLCAAVRLFRKAAKKEALMPFLGKAYFALCKEVNIRSLTLGEFSSMIITLSDQGMLNVSKARDTAKRKVSLRVNEKNILFALQEVRLFRCLLEGLVDA